MAVDEPRNGAQAAAVDLDDVAADRRQIAHPPDRGDRLALAEDVGVLEDLDLAELSPAQRRTGPGRRRHLREVADEQRHASGDGTVGTTTPPRSAASIA